jgi:hypothetical protein
MITILLKKKKERNIRHPQSFSQKVSSQMMGHNFIKLWHIF